ncbi:EF-hand domain-containing protein [Yoonia sp. 2307UL14-13]|uniref:EF-hand domain-containing protein n=1 Tax=Yoonia sp. 2307UL14-13 TaxID=3126506 RepID=UPI0030A7820C
MTKKTETLELRLSPELKEALSDVSKSRNTPMSQIVRSLVECEISPQTIPKNGKDLTMMTPTWTKMLTASACMLGLASLSLLSNPGNAAALATARVTFAEFDLNADGKITPDEFEEVEAAWLAEDALTDAEEPTLPTACAALFEEEGIGGSEDGFASYDLNGDGQITFDEVTVMTEAMLTLEFQDLDHDGNGLLSEGEMTSISFTVDDLIEDGLDAACATVLVEREKEWFDDDAVFDTSFFASIDTNLDGHVTMSEFIENH